MKHLARLIVRVWVKGEPMVYQCSLCDQAFVFSEEGTAKESVADLWSAFRNHVREYHPEDLAGLKPDEAM